MADNLPLYGVCCYMDEMVHRSPAVLASAYPNSNKPLSRYLVAAPRCYAFLTHFPFFSLHMKVGPRLPCPAMPENYREAAWQATHRPAHSLPPREPQALNTSCPPHKSSPTHEQTSRVEPNPHMVQHHQSGWW